MATIYRHVLEKGYLSLLKTDVVVGLLLIMSMILLQFTTPNMLPIDTDYIPWLGLAMALCMILVGYWQWEAKVYSLRRLHMDLARSTLMALTDARGQVDELLGLIGRCKVIETASILGGVDPYRAGDVEAREAKCKENSAGCMAYTANEFDAAVHLSSFDPLGQGSFGLLASAKSLQVYTIRAALLTSLLNQISHWQRLSATGRRHLKNAEQLAKYGYTKLLLVNQQDEARVLELAQEVLDGLKKAIKAGEAIGSAVNKVIMEMK